MPRVTSTVSAIILAQQGQLFLWMPVCLGLGISVYFSVKVEPQQTILWIACIPLATAFLIARLGFVGRALLIGLCAIVIGFVIAFLRSHSVAEPRLGFRYYGPVEGRIVAIDRSASDAERLTLDQVVLHDVRLSQVPARVRVALHGDQSHFAPFIGDTIVLAAHLGAPAGPVEPGGFDFQRHAWFQQLGAVGYTRSPALVLVPADHGLWVNRVRQDISSHIQTVLPERTAGFASAVTTGDRSGINQANLDSLRASNLAHLLAISGLHMGMLSGFVFALVRGGLALTASVSMRLPTKKIAAISALCVASLYLGLSGGAVATERAFVMVAVALVAVLLDRRAISLRAVAVAALIILFRTPEALLSPGFQMSFAATTALVAVFSALRDLEWSMGPKWMRPIVATVLSSAVAGLATAPIGAAHFNQISQMGLIANILSVPVMGAVVVPGGVLAAILAPFGADWIGLHIMGFGLNWIMEVSDWVAGFKHSVRMVPQPDRFVLPLLAFGALWAAFWRGPTRLGGVAMVLISGFLWAQTQRPYILVSDNAGLVGVMTETGRALSKPRGSGFVAEVWLENDGDPSTQLEANEGWEDQILHITGKKTVEKLIDSNGRGIVVVNAQPPSELPCFVILPKFLASTGSISISEQGEIRTSRDVHGARMWHPWTENQ